MKFLNCEVFDVLNPILADLDAGDCRIMSKLECYTFKSTAEDKKLKTHLTSKYNPSANGSSFGNSDPEPLLSPPSNEAILLRIPQSPIGSLADPHHRKTLFYLIATLNNAFPDYDFSDTKPEFFTRVPSITAVFNEIESLFHQSQTANKPKFPDIPGTVFQAIDSLIPVDENSPDMEVYSFNPTPQHDPSAGDGCLWSFYYFFVDRKLKRCIVWWGKGLSGLVSSEEDLDGEPGFDMEMDDMSPSDTASDFSAELSRDVQVDSWPSGFFGQRHRNA